MTTGIEQLDCALVEGTTPDKPRIRPTINYSQLLRVLGRWRRRYYGWDYRETMAKLAVRATVPGRRSNGSGMTPACYDLWLGLPGPEVKFSTYHLMLVKDDGISLRTMGLEVARQDLVEEARALGKLRKTNRGFTFLTSGVGSE